MVRCYDCAFLGDEPDRVFTTGLRDAGYLGECAWEVYDLDAEARAMAVAAGKNPDATDSVGQPVSIYTERVAVYRRERDCDRWMRRRPHMTPKEHSNVVWQ